MQTYPVITAVKPLDDYRLALTFGNSEKRIYDFKPNLSHKYYQILSDINLFNRVSVNNGEVEWTTGQDFCPHTLYIQSIPVDI